jgi:hypothetical protein
VLDLMVAIQDYNGVTQVAHPCVIEGNVTRVRLILDIFHGSVLSVVDAASRTGFADDYAGQFWQLRLQARPDPACQILARRVLEPWDLVQEMVVELILQGLEGALHVGEIEEPTHVLIDCPSESELDAERVAVQASALVSEWHIRQHVSRLERKLLIDLQA